MKNMKSCKLNFCKYCVLQKANQGLFQGYKKENRMKRILDYIHSDMWGATRTKSHDGACYYVTMDDYSQKIWVYFMQKKFEVFAKFKEWKVKVENQTGGRSSSCE